MCANCKMINETSQKIYDFLSKNKLTPIYFLYARLFRAAKNSAYKIALLFISHSMKRKVSIIRAQFYLVAAVSALLFQSPPRFLFRVAG